MMQPGNRQDVWDDELSLELPAHPPLDQEEESYTPEDDTDLGLPLGEQAENVGLDSDAGLDEPLEAELELNEADEQQSYSDADETDDSLEDDPDLANGAENGWTQDNETPEAQEFDDELSELDDLSTGDAGEEGFEDESAAAELRLPERSVGIDQDPELDLPLDDLELDTPLPARDGE
jgi:hypothetical protein